MTKIQRKIKKLVSYAISAKNKPVKSVLWGNIDSIKALQIFMNTNLNLEGYSYEINSSSVKHIIKYHSNKIKQEKQKQIAISKKDFVLIP